MLSIIIVTYKSNERTIKYVHEELSKISTPHKIVLVNNGSEGDSSIMLAKALDAVVISPNQKVVPSKPIIVINNPENSGFAKGNNIGARFSIDILGCNTLLFSNNDIRFIDSDVVDRMESKFHEIPIAGIIGPKVIGLKGEYQSPEPYISFWDKYVWMFLCTPFYSAKRKAERFQFYYSDTAKEGFHYKLMGSFFMVRSKDFIKCGMMDEHTFLYAEEMILTERMKKIGLKPFYYPEVSVLHDHGATTKKHLKGNMGSDIQFNSNCYYYRTYMHTPLWQIWIGKFVHHFKKLVK